MPRKRLTENNSKVASTQLLLRPAATFDAQVRAPYRHPCLRRVGASCLRRHGARWQWGEHFFQAFRQFREKKKRRPEKTTTHAAPAAARCHVHRADASAVPSPMFVSCRRVMSAQTRGAVAAEITFFPGVSPVLYIQTANTGKKKTSTHAAPAVARCHVRRADASAVPSSMFVSCRRVVSAWTRGAVAAGRKFFPCSSLAGCVVRFFKIARHIPHPQAAQLLGAPTWHFHNSHHLMQYPAREGDLQQRQRRSAVRVHL